jgi:hypothetical protein
VRVQGEYVLQVGSEEVQLGAKLKYTIRGAKVRSLELTLPGWEVDLVGPANLVNVDAAIPSQNGSLLIPLLQASSGDLELVIEAHKKISRDDEAVTLELPQPQAETVAPANVAVVPADNIELAFDAERAVALAPQTVRPQMKLPERLQDPLFFRTEGAVAKFAASIKVHEQAISATMATQLDVSEPETQVDERIAFRIAYEPADHLVLIVPRAIRPDRLAISLDGQRLTATTTRDRAGEPGDTVPMRVALPSPRIGRCELQLRYSVRHEKPSGADTVVNVPLVVPGEGQVTADEVVVVPTPGLDVSYPAGPWNMESANPPAAASQTLTLSARRALTEISLKLAFKERVAAEAITISRAWLQSRLTDARRQDRAVFRLTTNEQKLQLRLPEGADANSLELNVDGRRVAADSLRQRDVSMILPPAAGGEHLLELRYYFSDRQAPGLIALDAPQINTANWVRQFYWQLVLPTHEHVVFAPEHYTREYRWTWANLFWQRQPSLDERELESWSGASPAGETARLADETADNYAARQQLASRSTNRYLFSTVGGAQEPLQLYTMSRARLVLWASLPLLLCGLLLIYFPVARHPGVMFALAVLIAAGSMVDPDLALLAAQASTLGMVLAISAVVLARRSARAPLPTVPVRGSSKALVERGGTEIYHRAPSNGSQPSTRTDPVVSTTSPEAES